ncbi:tyrosine-type recombinase/integrase [Burkholderia orbicola]|uniref:tyrosine-type recombinase/integrase n=1 Tax=Burkholderia orbicola TaxID=2978683 RepID=UPI002FE04027
MKRSHDTWQLGKANLDGGLSMVKVEQNNRQLFRIIRNMPMPDVAARDPSTGAYAASVDILPAAVAMCWPDGRPCHEVEMYLLEACHHYSARSLDGGSLRVIASQLSPLIRYCWTRRIQFRDLEDGHFAEAIGELRRETHPRRPGKQRRNNNTTNRIIATWIQFLRWLQAQPGFPHVIVGTTDQDPRIPLIEKRTIDRFGHKHATLTYRLAPPSSTPEDVRGPISRRLRQSLWDAAVSMSAADDRHNRYRRRFDTDRDFLDECEYLSKRRQLVLDLLEATGARPGELARISTWANRKCAEEQRLVLPTLKRRKAVDPLRSIPVNGATALRVDVFIRKYRQPMLNRLRRQGLKPQPKDVLLLTVQGKPVTEALLEKEFRRIVAYAGLEDERACMAMFRHRFLTNMVKLHLLAFMGEHPGRGRTTMTFADYRTVLTRILPFTNHADANSLLHYIDLAWDELGVFDYAEPARVLGMAVEQGLDRLTALEASIRSRRASRRDKVLQSVLSELQQMRQEVSDALEHMARMPA